MRAVVTGMMATFPLGGVAWDYGQYAVGLERLGFEVFYLEDTGCYAYDPRTGEDGSSFASGAEFVAESLALLSPSLADRWHVRGLDGEVHGIPADEMAEVVASADVLLNVSGSAVLREEYLACPRKVLIDTDPGWNHFVVFPRQQALRAARGLPGLDAHDEFATYAERLGAPDCPLPSLGLDWRPTRPPVVCDLWAPQPPGERWTTVMMWQQYPEPIVRDGVTYTGKEPEFARIESLPERASAPLEVAVGGAGAPRERWRELGWRVLDSTPISTTAAAYRDYVAGSRGELSVAKNVYVATRSGWFSCRSVCYLAAGRPAVVQDTGFGELAARHDGLLPFSSLDQAAAALAEAERDYERHSEGARALAAERFDSGVVLSELLERVGVS